MNEGIFQQRRRRTSPPPLRRPNPTMGETDTKNTKRKLPRRTQKSIKINSLMTTIIILCSFYTYWWGLSIFFSLHDSDPAQASSKAASEAAAKEFRDFLAEQAARRGAELRNRIAAARVQDLLEEQLAMIRLTRQMNKLLEDLRPREGLYTGTTPNSKKSTKKPKPTTSNEYVIFSGGPKGLEYTSLTKSETGTFCMEIDVSAYDPEHVLVSTEDNRTMHVRATSRGVRKTMKIISPDGIDIDDVIIHYPKHGILLLEAP